MNGEPFCINLYMQTNAVAEPRVTEFRAAIVEVIDNKHSDTPTRMGIYIVPTNSS